MATKAEPSFSLADRLFNAGSVQVLADAMARSWQKFDKARFTQDSLAAFPDLELKARIRHMVDRLDEQLGADGLGEVLGGAWSPRWSYVDLILFDEAPALERLRSARRDLLAPARDARLGFHGARRGERTVPLG